MFPSSAKLVFPVNVPFAHFHPVLHGVIYANPSRLGIALRYSSHKDKLMKLPPCVFAKFHAMIKSIRLYHFFGFDQLTISAISPIPTRYRQAESINTNWNLGQTTKMYAILLHCMLYSRGLKLKSIQGLHFDKKRARGPHREKNCRSGPPKRVKSTLILKQDRFLTGFMTAANHPNLLKVSLAEKHNFA